MTLDSEETSPEPRWISAISLMVIVGVIFFLFFLAYEQFKFPPSTQPWLSMIYDIMVVYLGFVSLRMAVTLFFSFADRFFKREFPPLARYPLVSVIVPCFNEEKVVEKAVISVSNIDYPNFEIIVVDDGSTDVTLLLAKSLESRLNVRVIYQKNQGKSEALNRGISEALGEYIFSIDADSVLDRGVFRKGVPYLESDPKMAAVAGNVVVGNATNLLSAFQLLEYVVGLNFQKSAQSFLSMVTIIPGPNGLFRRSAVIEVGGYHSTTFAEDCDLTIRLLMHGYRTSYCNEMIAYTEAPEDYLSLMKQRYRWSRGTLQAVKVNSKWLFSPFKSFRNFFILLYFFGESMVIPTANFIFAFFTVGLALYSGSLTTVGPFFLQITILDLIITTYSVLFERRMGFLVFLSVINRASYGFSMEILRFVAVIDELLGLPMTWNKLTRKGL